MNAKVPGGWPRHMFCEFPPGLINRIEHMVGIARAGEDLLLGRLASLLQLPQIKYKLGELPRDRFLGLLACWLAGALGSKPPGRHAAKTTGC